MEQVWNRVEYESDSDENEAEDPQIVTLAELPIRSNGRTCPAVRQLKKGSETVKCPICRRTYSNVFRDLLLPNRMLISILDAKNRPPINPKVSEC